MGPLVRMRIYLFVYVCQSQSCVETVYATQEASVSSISAEYKDLNI